MSLELLVSQVSKRYGSETILNNCSFTVKQSGIYVLVGPNGRGKSTFLRICALLEAPDSGDVDFYSEGRLLTKDISLMRRITLLLPKIGVFNTSVYKNVAYGLTIRDLRKNDIASRGEHALDFVGLFGKKNQKAVTLSTARLTDRCTGLSPDLWPQRHKKKTPFPCVFLRFLAAICKRQL